ncbi:MAG: DUF2937 family protein [Pseudomonadota bacterium]
MIIRFVHGFVAVVGALGAGQFPAFYQQYLQRLGGRLDQAESDVGRLIEDAQRLGRTLDAYISELMESGSEAARQAAIRELERVDNAGALANAYERLSSAQPWERPVVFADTFDPAVAKDTMAAFQPAFQLTTESLAHGAVGMLVALGLYTLAEVGARRLSQRIRKQEAT